MRKLRHDYVLQKHHDELLSEFAYRFGTSYKSFRENLSSSVERAVIKANEYSCGKRTKLLKQG